MERNFIPPLPPNPAGQAKLILKAHALAFVKPRFFKVDAAAMAKEQSAANLPSEETLSDSRSKFGLPVFDTILFQAINYKTNEDVEVKVPNFSMSTVLAEVSQTRNIVATQIAGRNGTVKEYISDGDFLINIKGVLCSLYQNIPPRDSVNQLMGFCSCPDQFKVSSNFLDYFGIYSIVIKDYKFNQMEGQRNVIGFELSCWSDTPFEIKGSLNKSVPSFI